MTQKEKTIVHFYRALERNDLKRLRDIFHAFFASIPHDWYRKNDLSGYEDYYASIFYCYFTALGLTVHVEDATDHGRLDMAVEFGDTCFIFEFKVVELDPGQERALEQIRRKRYHEKYAHRFIRIYLVGVEFSKDEHNITSFQVEEA